MQFNSRMAMFGLIRLIILLVLISGLAVYSGDIWDGIKERIGFITDPETRRANFFESFKNDFSDIEEVIRELEENIDNPDFDKKAKLEEGLKLIEESRSNFEKIERSDSSLIDKAFEGLRDFKKGVQSVFSGGSAKKEEKSPECRCLQ